jgi:hypothetical protein
LFFEGYLTACQFLQFSLQIDDSSRMFQPTHNCGNFDKAMNCFLCIRTILSIWMIFTFIKRQCGLTFAIKFRAVYFLSTIVFPYGMSPCYYYLYRLLLVWAFDHHYRGGGVIERCALIKFSLFVTSKGTKF